MSKQTVERLIEERGGGESYTAIMKTTGDLQNVFKDKDLTSERRAYLNILCHKMARLIHGYGDDDDNLLDIAGYSELERRDVAPKEVGLTGGKIVNGVITIEPPITKGFHMGMVQGSSGERRNGLTTADIDQIIKGLERSYRFRSGTVADPYSEGVRNGVRIAVSRFEEALNR